MLRRCGFGIARLQRDMMFDYGFYAALPGVMQTVPRSELFAVLVAIRLCAVGTFLHIVTDSLTTHDLFKAGVDGHAWRHSANADLWALVWAQVSHKSVTLHWVKAHVVEDIYLWEAYRPPLFHVVGNSCADVLADLGAKVGALPPLVVDPILVQLSAVSVIQRRLLALTLPILAKRELTGGRVSLRLPRLVSRLASDHALIDLVFLSV